MGIQTINPTTGEVLETFEPYSSEQVEEALDQARQAFLQWRTTTFARRAEYIQRVSHYLREHKTELASTAVLEMGKSLVEAEAEVEKCAWNCDYYAENAEHFLADEKVATNASEKLYLLSAARRSSCSDALEFSLLAGLSLCGSSAHGR